MSLALARPTDAGLSNWEKAAEDGASCISANKTFIKGYFRLATAQENMSDFKKAVECYTEAIDLGNEFPVMDPNNWNPSPLGECG